MESDELREVERLISSMPPWSASTDVGSREAAVAIQAACQRISSFPTPLIREAVKRIIQHDVEHLQRVPIDDQSRLFVTVRYIFDAPAVVPSSTAVFGGWLGIPRFPDGLDGRWPWQMNEHGEKILTGTYRGARGAPYLALEAFDYAEEHYVRRFAHPTTTTGPASGPARDKR